jgi:hypothetical protein
MKFLMVVRKITFKGDALKIPHWHYEQAKRFTADDISYGNLKGVVAKTHDAGVDQLRKMVGEYLRAWHAFDSGVFTMKDFTFSVSFTEIADDGTLWIIPHSSYCAEHSPV